jgi:hypothetical protein
MTTENAREEARPERKVRIHIDQKPYESPTPTTGEELYRLGKVQSGMELYREVAGDHEDKVVENDSEVVHLKEDEHFHSGPPREYTIIVRGRPRKVTAKVQSFWDIVALAYNPVRREPGVLYTVSYSRGPKANPEGELLDGQSVKIRDGMVFLVTETDKS